MTLRCRGGRGGPAAALCRCPAGLEELKEVLKALEKPFNKKLRLSQGPENSHPWGLKEICYVQRARHALKTYVCVRESSSKAMGGLAWAKHVIQRI